MNKLIWTLQILVALAFAASGGMKLATPDATLRANPQMAWTQGFSHGDISAIGVVEVVGALGLIVPAATGIAPVLTPIAGAGLAVLMGGAVSTHVGRGELPIAPLVLGTLALGAGLLRWQQRRRTTGVGAPHPQR
jgi:uncharacterized membrane protein YphA (DoxX/SURF4 family)